MSRMAEAVLASQLFQLHSSAVSVVQSADADVQLASFHLPESCMHTQGRSMWCDD